MHYSCCCTILSPSNHIAICKWECVNVRIVKLISIYVFTSIGAHDHLQPFDIDLWLTCMSRKSRIPPRLYPEEFERCAVYILDRALDLNPRDVSHENCRNIYVKLLRIIEACINSGISYSTLGIDSEEDEGE